MERIRTLHWLYLLPFVFLGACSGISEEKENKEATVQASSRYGGLLRINYSQHPVNLFPLSITSTIGSQIAQQAYEGLFKLDPADLSIKPCLAESWSWSDDRKTLTVNLKKGVYFHNDPCFKGEGPRPFRAQDVVYCFTQMATPGPLNQSFHLIEDLLEGASAYYEAQQEGAYEKEFHSVAALGPHTVVFKLKEPNALFISFLARVEASIYPQEAFDYHGLGLKKTMVGTGPFVLSSYSKEELLLARNSNYHQKDMDGNPLPYLAGLSISFVQDKKAELVRFKEEQLEMVYMIPAQYLTEVIADHMTQGEKGYSHYLLQRTPELSTEILGFNLQDPLFSNKYFRKALAFAIDRKALVQKALNGGGYAAEGKGFIPGGQEFYSTKEIEGYAHNKDSAYFYLKKAGFDSGKDVPILKLAISRSGDNAVETAVLIKEQLASTLGIEVNIDVLPFSEFLDHLINGKISMYRIGWSAEFPNPGEFLSVFKGAAVPRDPNEMSFPNVSRYTNPRFDQWYQKAILSETDSISEVFFQKAEQVLMEDCPMVILWYREGYQLLQPYVRNLGINPIQYRDYREVYFERPELLTSEQ